MKQLTITIAIILLILQVGKSDDFSCTNMDHKQRVISENGLFIRSEPNIKSQPLFSVPFWGIVDVCRVSQGLDTINNIVGNWRKVKYQNITGYMFDGYLTYSDSTVDKQKNFRFFREGYLCSLANYDPVLNWYGLYESEFGDSLVRVEIVIRKPTLDDRLELPTFIICETNLSSKKTSKFLIGSKKPLEEGLVNNRSLKESVFLYPGQEYNLSGGNKKLFFFNTIKIGAIGNVTENIQYPRIENYGFQLVDQHNGYKSQDITGFFTYQGDVFRKQNIYWYGDIDGDKSVDLIFLFVGNEMASFTLLLSSLSNSDQFVAKADEWIDGYCN